MEKLKIPLAGVRGSNSFFLYRGYYAYLWTSNDTARFFAWYYSTIDRGNRDKNNGFSVRCIKD